MVATAEHQTLNHNTHARSKLQTMISARMLCRLCITCKCVNSVFVYELNYIPRLWTELEKRVSHNSSGCQSTRWRRMLRTTLNAKLQTVIMYGECWLVVVNAGRYALNYDRGWRALNSKPWSWPLGARPWTVFCKLDATLERKAGGKPSTWLLPGES